MKATSSTYRVSDFGGWMNTFMSPAMIQNKQWVLYDNFTVDGNILTTLKGYQSFIKQEGKWPVQGLAVDRNVVVWIADTNLYLHNTIIGDVKSLTGVVGVGISGIVSRQEDYNITIYKQHIIITNSLKTGKSPLNYEGEVARRFEFVCDDKTTSLTRASYNLPTGMANLDEKYAPTCSMVYNGICYLGGWPITSQYRNYITNSGFENIKGIDLWWATDKLFYFSQSDGGGFAQVGDTTEVVGFAQVGGQFYVAKRNSIFDTNISFDNSTGTTTLSFRQVTSNGARNQECFINIDRDIVYFDGRRVRRISYEMNNTTLSDDSISEEVQQYIDALGADQIFACSLYAYPLYKVYLRGNQSDSSNNVALCHNTINKSWNVQTGINVRHCTTGFDTNSISQGFFWSLFDNEIMIDNVGYSYNGKERSGKYISKSISFGDSIMEKRLTEIAINGDINPWFIVKVKLVKINEGECKLMKWSIEREICCDTDSVYHTTGNSQVGNSLTGQFWKSSSQYRKFWRKFETFQTSKEFFISLEYNGIGDVRIDFMRYMYRFLKSYTPNHY